MSVRAIAWAFKQHTGSHATKLVLVKIADNANDKDECWPSLEYIARECEMTRRSVIRCIKTLEALGIVVVERRKSAGVSISSIYRLAVKQEIGSDATSLRVVTNSHHGSDKHDRGGDRKGKSVVTQSHPNRHMNHQEPSLNRFDAKDYTAGATPSHRLGILGD